jgi:hypothetical protein
MTETKAKAHSAKRSRSDVFVEERESPILTTTIPESDAEKSVAKKAKTKAKSRKVKKLNHLLTQKTVPACIAPAFSGSLNERQGWYRDPSMAKDHHSRVLSDTQIANVDKCFKTSRDVMTNELVDGVPTRSSIKFARQTIKSMLRLVGPDVIASSFKILGTSAFDGSGSSLEEDPAIIMAFMAGAQRQVSAALVGRLDGALSVLARSLQGPLAKENVVAPYSPISSDYDGSVDDYKSGAGEFVTDHEKESVEPSAELFS